MAPRSPPRLAGRDAAGLPRAAAPRRLDRGRPGGARPLGPRRPAPARLAPAILLRGSRAAAGRRHGQAAAAPGRAGPRRLLRPRPRAVRGRGLGPHPHRPQPPPGRSPGLTRKAGAFVLGNSRLLGSDERRDVAVAVADGRVVAAEKAGGPRLDLGGRWLLPGLVNAHDQLDLSVFPPLASPPFLRFYRWPASAQAPA